MSKVVSDQFKILVRTYAGLEDVLFEEVMRLGGANPVRLNRAVECEGDKGFIYKLNLGLRTALRVLKPLHAFSFKDNQQFHQEIMSIDWPSYFSVEKTFAFDSIVFSSLFNNSMFVSQLAKDALCDRFRQDTGKRPFVDGREPQVRISIYVRENEATVYLDSSGESLHLRGYRTEQVKAPLSEVMAAGILKISGWSHHFPLIDPMCGSGTFSIEAALLAAEVPAGIFRQKFGFEHWNDYDPELFQTILNGLTSKIKEDPLNIKASDIHHRAVSISRDNAGRAGVDTEIHFSVDDFLKSSGPDRKAFIFINPPYGERLHPADLEAVYTGIGSTLKHKYPGCEAWVFTSNPEAIRLIGLKPSKKIKLFNGPLECQLLRYEMYSGTKKNKSTPE